MPIGYEFEPGQEKRLRTNLNRSGGSLSPASQQAIKILSTRLPSVLGGRPPAPADLLKPSVGGNSGPGAVASSIMRASGAGGPSAVTQPTPALSSPSMESPTAAPFAALQPSAGSTETSQLASVVNNALGGSSPTPNFGFGEPGKTLNPPPIPSPSAPPDNSNPIDLHRPVSPTPAPDNSLDELLRLISLHNDWGGMNGAGSFGNEG